MFADNIQGLAAFDSDTSTLNSLQPITKFITIQNSSQKPEVYNDGTQTGRQFVKQTHLQQKDSAQCTKTNLCPRHH